jgi:hypothetical protein
MHNMPFVMENHMVKQLTNMLHAKTQWENQCRLRWKALNWEKPTWKTRSSGKTIKEK